MRRLNISPVILTIAVLAALYGWAVLVTTPTHPGSIGFNLNALGTDWMVFYSGVQWFFDGNLAALFDGDRFTAYLNSNFSDWLSAPVSFRPWVYPPTYLLVMLPFGALPFTASYVAFQLASAVLFAAALYFYADRPNARVLVIAAALLGPAAAINAAMGQNAFLTAALLVGGFRVLRTCPALGGAILGILTIKPHFWLLVPVALAAEREWKALSWSILSAVGLALASVAVFGVDSWLRWLDLALGSYADAHGKWVELGRMWGESIYACLISAGAPESLANGAQIAGILVGIGLVYGAFRQSLPNDQKIAILLAVTILAAPHSSLADTVLLAAAAALWCEEAVQHGQPLAKWVSAFAIWLAPLFNPPLVSAPGRFTPLLILAFAAVTMAGAGRPGRPGLFTAVKAPPAPRAS